MKFVKVRRSVDFEATGLGKKIQEARKADGRSLEALSAEAGISRVYWYDIEAERVRDALPEDTLRRIEQVLGADFEVKFE